MQSLLAPMVFTRHYSADFQRNWVTVGGWHDTIIITSSLVMEGDREIFQPDEGGITLTVANGYARYRWTGINEAGQFEGVHERSSWQPPQIEGCADCPHPRHVTRMLRYGEG